MADYTLFNNAADVDTAIKRMMDNSTDFNIGSNTLVVDKSSNRVGIGTTAPAELFHISESADVDAEMYLQATGTNKNCIFHLNSTGTGYGSISKRNGNAGDLRIQSNSNSSGTAWGDIRFRNDGTDGAGDIMILDGENGNVGIGTTIPEVKLSVTTTDGIMARFERTFNGGAHGRVDISGAHGYPQIIYNYADTKKWAAGVDTSLDAFVILDGDDLNQGSRKLTVEYTGNVGIGTSAPSQKLEVMGTIKAQSVAEANSAVSFSGSETTTKAGTINIGSSGSQVKSVADSDISLWTDSSNRLHIDSSGNVGIGTSAPSAKLDVNGVITSGGTGNLTISSGEITITHNFHKVDTENDESTDDLETINGGVTGAILVLKSVNNTRDITLKDSSDNLRLAGDFTLSNNNDSITLIYDGSNWLEISRSDNA